MGYQRRTDYGSGTLGHKGRSGRFDQRGVFVRLLKALYGTFNLMIVKQLIKIISNKFKTGRSVIN